jgi:hypothetical protein
MNNKKLKRREEKEGNNKKRRSKSYTVQKRKNRKKLVPKGSAKLRWAGRRQGISYFIAFVDHKGYEIRDPLTTNCGPVERKKSLTWAAQVR